MLVHIVNSGNKSYYAEFLEEMFAQRKKLFVETMGWNDLPMIDGIEKDEMDLVEDVEYLLIFDKNGDLVGHCRYNPTTSNYLLGTAMKKYVMNPIQEGYDCWEFTRFAPSWDLNSPHKKLALAYLCAATIEWSLIRRVNRLLGIGEENLIQLAGALQIPTRLLGTPIEYDTGRSAIAFEFALSQRTLNSTRQFFKLDAPATLLLPPQIGKSSISRDDIAFYDAAMNAREPIAA
ncbi:acyl-homoserine-lactone synthase [Pseudaquidulcibacter saccharophilus]|uniref:acyl-homoserine-lactone synthase n=1 Tax=Pseudaquidulcibacter saccharophilus TaxID=2831900 RepID=UPI001EFF01DE|nr:acyl-homoserine-lactone synthase [Pseudaquidulcibacter saccharophilus]